MMVMMATPICLLAMLLGEAQVRSGKWEQRLEKAVKRVRAAPTADHYATALDAAFAADDSQAGRGLAHEAQAAFPENTKLAGRIARALWRSGELERAEETVASLPADTQDPIAIAVRVRSLLSRGKVDEAGVVAARLEKLLRNDPENAPTESWAAVFEAHLASEGAVPKVVALIRLIEGHVDAEEDGYPAAYIAESLDGLATFLDRAGPGELNRITEFGEAYLRPLPLLGLPYCDVHINGKGPFRMVLDTGGSVLLSVDREVAAEAGLASLGTASVRGVSGASESDHAIAEQVRIGGVEMQRVTARVFEVRKAVANAADGIIGTGIFASARMTIDFADSALRVSPSSDAPADGTELALRILADAKLYVRAKVNDRAAWAFLDTGADAAAISPALMQKLHPDAEPATMAGTGAFGVGGGPGPEVSMGHGVKLEIGGRTYETFSGVGLDIIDTLLSPAIGVHVDLLLGMPLFRDIAAATVDYPTARMWVQWRPPAD